MSKNFTKAIEHIEHLHINNNNYEYVFTPLNLMEYVEEQFLNDLAIVFIFNDIITIVLKDGTKKEVIEYYNALVHSIVYFITQKEEAPRFTFNRPFIFSELKYLRRDSGYAREGYLTYLYQDFVRNSRKRKIDSILK